MVYNSTYKFFNLSFNIYIDQFTALKEERKKETSPQKKEIKKEEKDPLEK